MDFATPRKRRLSFEHDDLVTSPKKRRTAPQPTSNLYNLHNAIEQALSLAIATSTVGLTPTINHIPNLINHLSIGGTRSCTIEDLSRIVWLWEWDGKSIPESDILNPATRHIPEDDNPFLVSSSKEWTRGGMGLVVTPTTHMSQSTGKRVPVYGIGIQVDKAGPKGGIMPVAVWATRAESRRASVRAKLDKYKEVHTILL